MKHQPAKHKHGLLALALLLYEMPPLLAQTTLGTAPEWGRPLSPAEGREMRAEIARLARSLGLRENTLSSIARILGANLGDIGFPELISRVRTQADRAAELQTRITALEAQIGALEDSPVRTPAELALERAIAAFNNGRLDDADREFSALEVLRLADTAASRAAWIEAVEARARIAELRFDYDTAEVLRLTAMQEERRATGLSVVRQWQFVMAAADARFRQGDISGNGAALERAIALYRDEAMPLAPRSERPADWAGTQNDLGVALLAVGEREARSTSLEQAVVHFELALQVRTRDRLPREWATTQNNLGNAYFRLGSRQPGRGRLRRAETAFRAALEVFTPDQFPIAWARTTTHLANVLSELGARERGSARLEQATQMYEEAVAQIPRQQDPFGWAMATSNLANSLMIIGKRRNDPAQLERAVGLYEIVVEEWSRDRYPLLWGMMQYNLGLALHALGQQEAGTARLERAVQAFTSALQELTRQRDALGWASATTDLADAVALICMRSRECRRLDAAESRLREAQADLRAGGHGAGLYWANQVLRRIAQVRRRVAA